MIHHPMLILGGTSNPKLTAAICESMGMQPGRAKVEVFPDSEKLIRLESDVRGKDCFVVQPTCAPVDSNLMELLIFLDCLTRASAARVTAVVSYFGYARQDRKDAGRVPITAKLAANLITTAGANRLLAIDLHAKQLQGFFDIPVDHLTAEPVFLKYFRKKAMSDLTVVAPDVGNMKTASRYATALGGELVVIHKRRVSGAEVECEEIIGNVAGRNILMVDDMISTAGTVSRAAALVKSRGAGRIVVGATHGVFSGTAVERIKAAPIDEIVVTDTIPLDGKAQELKNMKVLSVASLLSEAIRRIHMNESVSGMFENLG